MRGISGHPSIWRRSAAVLLMCPSKLNNIPRVLMVKRSGKSSAFSNAHVFPGGLCDDIDSSLGWVESFPALREFQVPKAAVYPDLFKVEESLKDSQICPQMAFRLTGIRELFEETGILLAFPSDNLHAQDKTGRFGTVTKVDSTWRKKVHNSPELFLTMCKELKLIPNVWMLHDWSTWLTPIITKQTRRYDTQFYAAFVESPDVIPSSDDIEVTAAQFNTVTELLQLTAKGEVILHPPQFFELARMVRFTDIYEMAQYAVERGKLGTERWFPVRYICADGMIGVLPGDSMYPLQPDLRGEHPVLKTNMTVAECMELFPRHNRMVHDKSKTNPSISVNIKLPLGQISCNPGIFGASFSKL